MSNKNITRNAPRKDDDHEYGRVTKKLGSGRFLVKLALQNKEVMGRLCGKFKKGAQKKDNIVDVDTVVLVGLRDFQDNVVDIVYVYKNEEVRILKKCGEIIDESFKSENKDENEEEDIGFDFETL